MAKNFNIKIEKNQLKVLEDALKQYASSGIKVDTKKATKLYASALYKEVKSNTPVITGALKRSWFIKTLDDHTILVHNTKKYAIYVEYGHRVRKDKGKWLDENKGKKNWIKGRHFVRKSINNFKGTQKEEIKKIMVENLQKQIKRKKNKK